MHLTWVPGVPQLGRHFELVASNRYSVGNFGVSMYCCSTEYIHNEFVTTILVLVYPDRHPGTPRICTLLAYPGTFGKTQIGGSM